MHSGIRSWQAFACALGLGVVLLAGCGVEPQARAAPASSVDILPTPPPMPTSAPLPPTPAPPPAPAARIAPAGATTLLQADFSSAADLGSWAVVDAAETTGAPSIWKIGDGHLIQVSDGDGMLGMYATALVTGDPAWRDYSASAAAYTTGNDEMGVVVRASDAGFYVFRLLHDGSQTSRILARYDAAKMAFTTIASADGTGFETGRWYTLTLRAQGDQLTALVDGQLALAARDTTLSQGRAGVYGYAQGNLLFDTFTVQSTPSGRS